jgi:transcriptional regulator with XRE-family HTH domain
MKELSSAASSNDIDNRIASRVRVLRSELRMTLEALAASSGVSRSMISLVERGEISATAVVLEKIAAGLNVSLATLFEDSGGPVNPMSRPADRISWRDPQSGYVRRNISPASFPSPIQIVEVQLPSGASVAYESGAREVNIHQQIWMQKGAVEVTIGNVMYRLGEDDCLAMRLNEPIAFRNRSLKAARYIVVLSTQVSRVSAK